MIKKQTKVLIRATCLLVILLLLSNCGPSLNTQIKQAEAEYSTLCRDQRWDIGNYGVKQASLDKNLTKWELSLSDEQSIQREKCIEQSKAEDKGVRCWKTLIDSLSEDQRSELEKIGVEWQSLNTIGNKIKERERHLQYVYYNLEYLLRKKQIEDMNNLMLLGILLSNVHVGINQPVQPPPQVNWLEQQEMLNRLRNIENQLRR